MFRNLVLTYNDDIIVLLGDHGRRKRSDISQGIAAAS